jgi:mycothiol system anti-sigma-R factor
MSEPNNPFTSSTGKRVTCMEMLQLILDGEVTHEQQEYFRAHMDQCMPCFESYQLDMTIKQLVKARCCGGEAPGELLLQIRAKINQKSA